MGVNGAMQFLLRKLCFVICPITVAHVVRLDQVIGVKAGETRIPCPPDQETRGIRQPFQLECKPQIGFL